MIGFEPTIFRDTSKEIKRLAFTKKGYQASEKYHQLH